MKAEILEKRNNQRNTSKLTVDLSGQTNPDDQTGQVTPQPPHRKEEPMETDSDTGNPRNTNPLYPNSALVVINGAEQANKKRKLMIETYNI